MPNALRSAIAGALNKPRAEQEMPEDEDIVTSEEGEEEDPDMEGDMPDDQEDPDMEGDMPDDDEDATQAAVAAERRRCLAIHQAGAAANQMSLASVLMEQGTSAQEAQTILANVNGSAPGAVKSSLAARHMASQGDKKPGLDVAASAYSRKDNVSGADKSFVNFIKGRRASKK